MSVLVIRLPARARLASRAAEAEAPERMPAEFEYVLAGPAGQLAGQGRAAPALLPRAARTLAVVADEDVSWHRVTLPRAPARRMRAALLGVLEEALLDDEEGLHFALPPKASPGQPGWVAVTHRRWLSQLLAELERHGVEVERVVPASEPVAAGRGHFVLDPQGPQHAGAMLVLAGVDGVACLRLAGGLARALVPAADAEVRWTATPAAAGTAEQWLGHPVEVLGDSERLLDATRSVWNLRQFDLVARHRGFRVLGGLGTVLTGPSWRAARWGLAALVAVQVAGLNAWAWQQRQAVAARKEAMVGLLRATHPQVRAVLDAPAQMARETARLRAAAGRPGEADLETLLTAAAGAWPQEQGPAQDLRFEPGRLILTIGAWSPAEVEQFRQGLRPAGYAADPEPGRIVVRRAAAGGSS
jgi:general secretion pathway protein L